MPRTCPRCSRVNPPEALFCYQDGIALGDHARQRGPINLGAKPFPFPFVFESGRSCRNFDELALACFDDTTAAVKLLRQGILANFLAGLGRADLVGAAKAAARVTEPARALDQLLDCLPTDAVGPAKLHVAPVQVNLGTLTLGEERRLELHVSNQGMRLLTGSVSAESFWLTVGDGAGASRKVFQCSHEVRIPIHVRTAQLRAMSKPLKAKLVVETNGGSVTVPVSFELPVQPFPNGPLAGAYTPRQVAEKAKAAPKQAALLFEDGSVARWYKSNGWDYPVKGPPAAGLGAVQQFFEALGLTPPPKVEVSEESIFLRGRPGGQLKHTLRVQTRENRPVYASASSDRPWLRVTQVQLGGRVATIQLTIPSVPDCPGQTLNACLTVMANGNQRFLIAVALEVTGRRTGASKADYVVPELEEEDIPVAPVVASSRGGEAEVLTLAVAEAKPRPREEQIVEALPMAEKKVKSQVRAGPVLDVRDVLADEEDDRPLRKRPGAGLVLLTVLPAVVLGLALLGAIIRDLLVAKPAEAPKDPFEVALPRIEIKFHDEEETVLLTTGPGGIKPGGGPVRNAFQGKWEPSMRFGLTMLGATGPDGKPKRLTYNERGKTNNTCLHLDGAEYLFGERPFRLIDGRTDGNWPGQWKERAPGKSVWAYDQQKVEITQKVLLVAGDQSGELDTCLVIYEMANHDRQVHTLGLRFMLDTYIGANDGVPFLIPGSKKLCDTTLDLRNQDVPAYFQAFEYEDLAKPGTVVQVRLRVGGGLEQPGRVTLGAWPDPKLRGRNPRCRQEKTGWEVPLLSIKSPELGRGDSAVTMYWYDQALPPGAVRKVGFAYGLGSLSAGEGKGQLALTLGGSFTPGGEFTLTAYVRSPQPGQSVTLSLPDGFELAEGAAMQTVPPLDPTAIRRISPVTWRVRAPRREGEYNLTVRSSTGVTQTQKVRIKAQGIFGN